MWKVLMGLRSMPWTILIGSWSLTWLLAWHICRVMLTWYIDMAHDSCWAGVAVGVAWYHSTLLTWLDYPRGPDCVWPGLFQLARYEICWETERIFESNKTSPILVMSHGLQRCLTWTGLLACPAPSKHKLPKPAPRYAYARAKSRKKEILEAPGGTGGRMGCPIWVIFYP